MATCYILFCAFFTIDIGRDRRDLDGNLVGSVGNCGARILGAVMMSIGVFLGTGMTAHSEIYIAHGLLFGLFGQASLVISTDG